MKVTEAEHRLPSFWPLAIVLIAYLTLGSLFAVLVPPWQVPDEPAHYNYVRLFATTGAYPVLAMGDYQQDVIANQVAPPTAKPDKAIVESLRYEDYEPPLFYTLAAPVYLLAGGALIPLRLFSLLIGAFVVLFAYLAIRDVFPTHPHIAAFTAAFVALLPQHLYMMGGFNNDSLSEALIALAVWLSVRYIRAPSQNRFLSLLPLAIVAGLGFLTKVQTYLALPVVLFAVLASGYRRHSAREIFKALVVVAVIAVLFGLPWWIHNLQVYGGTDLLGLQRHNQVVVGQPTTEEWIQQYGRKGLLLRMAQFTFQSFWGQFGWMSIVLDRRFYWLFLAVTAISTLLFLAWWLHSLSAWRRLRGKQTTSRGQSVYSPFLVLTREQTIALETLGVLMIGTLLAFIWYNLQFVQHQGRYLYMGLISIATAFSLGWHFIVSRQLRLQRWLWLAMVIAFIALDAHLLFRVILPAMR